MTGNDLKHSATVSNSRAESGKASAPRRRKALMIMGMHRSGTSAITGALGQLGPALPFDLMGPGVGNEKGHWEPEGIVALNDEILASAGSNWEDWGRFNPDWFASAHYHPALEKARLALRASFGDAPLFLLKDPRICRFVPFWIDVLKYEGVEPQFLLVLRDPTSVAASLAERDGMEHGYAYLLWLRHMLEAESATRGRDRVICTFDQLLDDWVGLFSNIGKKLSISWPKKSAQTRQDINNFLNHPLSKNSKTPRVILKITPWVEEAYSIFRRWADTGEKADDYARLDSILGEFNTASDNFSDLLLPGSRSMGAGGRHEMRQALEEAQRAAAEMAGVAELREIALRQREEEIAQANRERDEAIKQVERVLDLEIKLAEARDEIHQIEESRRADQDVARRAEVEIGNLKQKVLSVEAVNQSNGAALEIANVKLSEIRSNLAEALKMADAAMAEQMRLRHALSVAEGEVLSTAVNNEWLAKLNFFLLGRPRWWSLLPNALRRKRQLNALKRSGLFNAERYLEMHSDVAAAGVDPLQHYLEYGIRECRKS